MRSLAEAIAWPFKLFYWTIKANLTRTKEGIHMKIAKGTRLQVVRQFDSVALIHFRAPFTDGVACTLRPGTTLIAFDDSAENSDVMNLVPEQREKFEEEYVPAEIRNNEKYAGVSFVIPKKELGSSLRIS